MKNIQLVAIATLVILYACSPKMQNAQSKSFNTLSTDNNDKPMLLGECNKTALEQTPFSEWFNKNYTDYKINDTVLPAIKPLTAEKKFLIFMGTWCGDSKREVPRMLKILDSCGVNSSQIKLVMVDNHDSTYKQSPAHEEANLNIHRVPTLIVYENNKETGRIVEEPVVTLEKDLLAILRGEHYIPNYRAVIYLDSLFKKSGFKKTQKKTDRIAATITPLAKNAAELNTYGYVLMAGKDIDKAGLVFRLNTLLYPKVSNVFDSMGEFYFKTGKIELAKAYYQKVLELKPENKNAMEMLEKMKR
jgi:tetratricopeptide (TPR) repeat protein